MKKLIAEFKPCLRGAFQLCLFMHSGIEPFKAGDWWQTLRSFTWVLLFLPLSYLTVALHPPLGTEDLSSIYITNVSYLIGLSSSLIVFGIFFAFASVMKKQNRLASYISAVNWIGIVMFFISLPLLIANYMNWFDYKAIEDIGIVLTIYGLAISAYVFYRAFDIPWELAGCMIIVGLLVGETTHDAIYQLMDIPLVDYSEVF